MRTLNDIKHENPRLVPEGMAKLQQEQNVYILGVDYLEQAVHKLDEFRIQYKGVVSCRQYR